MFGITTFHIAVFFFFYGWGAMLAHGLWLADWHARRKWRRHETDVPHVSNDMAAHQITQMIRESGSIGHAGLILLEHHEAVVAGLKARVDVSPTVIEVERIVERVVEREVDRPVEVVREVVTQVEVLKQVEVDRRYQDLSKLPTIVDIIRSMGLEATTELNWKVGGIARKRHKDRYGRAPDKTLRQKTSGRGSHDLAVYPEEMRAEIEQVTRDALKEMQAKQPGVRIADPPPLHH